MNANLFAQLAPSDTTFVEGSVLSNDGTKIGYRIYGSNKPALIIVQGAMGIIVNYHELAKALSHNFTVYVPERRGRPLSPKEYTPDHSIEKDVDDVSCVINVSGASYVFGLSSGAIVTFEAAKVLPSIKKAAVYEPPFYVNVPVPIKKIGLVFTLISEGKTSAALANVFKIVKVGPKIFNYIPMPLLKLMTRAYIKSEGKQEHSRYAKISYLVPTMRFDFTDVLQRSGKVNSYTSIDKPVLLLGGTSSPKYLRDALDTLEKVLPNQRRIKFNKLDHNGPWNTDRGGSPEIVAKALIEFFKD